MRVEVYRNLHKKCFSVRFKGRVIRHVHEIVILNPTFVVQPAGNRKVRETGKKNVHAFVRGDWDSSFRDLSICEESEWITYNPYKHTSFINRRTEKPIYKADYALIIDPNEIIALNLKKEVA